MTADRPNLATAARRLLATLAAAAIPAVIAAAPAMAAAAPADCTPDDTTACVVAIVLDAENNPVPDVGVTISGAGFETDVTSTQEGPASVEVPQVGTYTLTLDEETVPDGLFPDATELQVTAQTGSSARAAFRLGTTPPESAEPSGGATTAPSEGQPTDAASAPAAGDEGLGGAGTAATGGGGPSLQQIWQQFGSGIRFGLLLALASVGISLIYGTTGLSSFSHGEQVTLGAMFGFIGINWLHLPIWLTVILVIVACAATGWLQDAAIWAPLRRRGTPVTQMMIVTIGLSLALQYAIQMVIGGRSHRVLPQNPKPLEIAGITLSTASWISMLVAVVVIFFIGWFLTRTRTGRATRAVSDNTALAAATGINPDRIIRVVWTMSTGFAGLAGMLLAVSFGSFNWSLGMLLLLLMFAAVTLGGLGTAYGALLGSLVIGLVVEMSTLIPGMPSDLRYASALVILILVLLFRPQGLLGRAERIG
ncbi:branched-chain amino acid ABC transporter permease [Promicromonospora sp. NPDC059942]|uniref:branched-chain amino acid ABC transporter permease n=1 Tax=Promicromonospora sp. NPDC059942 TaxID=3347009 RepID=UPI00364DE3F8